MSVEGPRGLEEGELEELLALVNRIFDPQGQRMGILFPIFLCESNREHLRVVKADGRIVSHVGVKVWDLLIGPARLRVGCVGSVCTDPAYRQRGFAQMALRDAIAHCREEGVDLFYVSGDRSLYRRHGCVRCGQVERFTLIPEKVLPWRRKGVFLEPFVPSHLERWIELHQAEPVRFHRPYEDWQGLMTPQPPAHWFGATAHFLTVLEGNEALAYVVLFIENRRGRVVEVAGDRRLVAAALAECFVQWEMNTLVWSLPFHERVARALCHQAGVESQWEANEGTVTILNWPQVGERVRPYLEERIGTRETHRLEFWEEEGRWGLAYGEERVELKEWGDLARLLFGPPPGEEVPPLPPGLAALWSRAFPLPRPRYGLSYI